MIEKNPRSELRSRQVTSESSRDLDRAKRIGIMPSSQLRRHFISLARRVRHWAVDKAGNKDYPFSVGITSINRRVGKSTIAFNMASAMTKVMRDDVLLVEADFGKHFISRRLGKAGISGLSDLMIDEGSNPTEFILPTPLGDLWVLGSGSVSERDSVELPFETLPPIMSKLDDFGCLVFDLPVADDLTSCFSLAQKIDGVILVVDAAKMDHRNIIRVRKKLESYGVDIIGMAINKS